ncbi:MAG: choice-of-anchor J domain-containing protein [Verrucomicrobiia bacterium]
MAPLAGTEYVDQTELLSTGGAYERRVMVASPDEPLKITLTYTDVPGLPAVLPALVNDLDLEVIGPAGHIYRGNQFIDGESVAGAAGADPINNVEGVHLAKPAPGDYLVRIRARNVVEDIYSRENVTPQQDFALVVSGDLLAPGVGLLIFDQPAYTAPATIRLKLIDTDLASQLSANVLLKSSTEASGELISLLPTGASGIYTGAVATVTGPATTDGKLQIAEGDSIEAQYQDAGPAAVRSASAVADLTPPVISSVTLTNHFGKEVINWRTDELTTAVVVYGTGADLTLAVTNHVVDFEHEVELNELAAGATYRFYVMAIDEGGNVSVDNNSGQFYSFVAKPAATVLLVNAYTPDDPLFQGTDVPVTTYTDALDETGVSYEIWDLTDKELPSPSAEDLKPFRVVIWRISDSLLGTSTLSPPQQIALETYVKGGGSLFMASMELLSRLGASSPFRTNVLQVLAFQEDVGVRDVIGKENDPIARGMYFPLDYSAYDNEILQLVGKSPEVSDTLTISTNAAPIFFDGASEAVAGLRSPRAGQESAGRVVFLSFPFDTVPHTGDPPNTRATLLRNILTFLAPGSGGLGTINLDRYAYTLPDLITIDVGDSDPAGQGTITVQCFSTSATNGVAVTLTETARQGLFRGSLALGSAPSAGKIQNLQAKEGDRIWVEYLDASGPSVVVAEAEVDAQPPVISDVAHEPDYEEAYVSWTTSEPSDALVQFGESTFLGRTAYSQDLSELHELILVGLQPDRIYNYRVVSRDHAGNTTVDDNGGDLYTLRTLRPIRPPWTDRLDAPDAEKNWSVEDDPEGQTSWRLGVPDNELQLEAYSPPNAWGSNLDGSEINVADTLLVSPAIHLTGGNNATLRFWQSYDFLERSDMDIYEFGQLYISTNKNADWVLLEEYGDLVVAWEQEEIDLTPYLGRVVQLGWSYRLSSLEASSRPGWMIDDISVTVTNLIVGTIHVTNSIAQATFSITGPVSRIGQGASTTFTNIPAGEYRVQFGDVPFYQTPPPQTKLVTASTPAVFQGDYTFVDENQNEISDVWEIEYFGSAASEHPGTTDSDGDGSSDLAEFLSGTDPIDPKSNLQLLSPSMGNASFKLTWGVTPGRNYRVFTSTNAVSWTPLTGWMRAGFTQTQLIYTFPLSDLATPRFFRIQATP